MARVELGGGVIGNITHLYLLSVSFKPTEVSFTSGAIGCIGYVGPFFAAFAIGNWTKNQEWHWVWLMCLVSAISQFFLSIVYWYFDRLSLAKKKNV